MGSSSVGALRTAGPVGDANKLYTSPLLAGRAAGAPHPPRWYLVPRWKSAQGVNWNTVPPPNVPP